MSKINKKLSHKAAKQQQGVAIKAKTLRKPPKPPEGYKRKQRRRSSDEMSINCHIPYSVYNLAKEYSAIFNCCIPLALKQYIKQLEFLAAHNLTNKAKERVRPNLSLSAIDDQIIEIEEEISNEMKPKKISNARRKRTLTTKAKRS